MELKRVITFTSTDESTIQVRHYEVPKITENAVGIEFKEIGPRFDFKIRRN